MKKTTLPFHATMRDPRTGAPVQALWVRPDGRHMWPIMGGAPDPDPDADKKAADDKAAADKKAADDKAAADKKAADDKAAADKAAGEKGFPADTPVGQMTVAQQAAYHKYHARKHEERNKAWTDNLGGLTPDEAKAKLDKLAELEREKMTDNEKAIADAKDIGKQEAFAAFAPELAKMAFESALGHLPEERRATIIDNIDLTKFVKPDGVVDTDKVKTAAAALAPSDKGPGKNGYGAGRGTHSSEKKGVSAGRERYQELHGTKKN